MGPANAVIAWLLFSAFVMFVVPIFPPMFSLIPLFGLTVADPTGAPHGKRKSDTRTIKSPKPPDHSHHQLNQVPDQAPVLIV